MNVKSFNISDSSIALNLGGEKSDLSSQLIYCVKVLHQNEFGINYLVYSMY